MHLSGSIGFPAALSLEGCLLSGWSPSPFLVRAYGPARLSHYDMVNARGEGDRFLERS